jgi:hypothetical protein
MDRRRLAVLPTLDGRRPGGGRAMAD